MIVQHPHAPPVSTLVALLRWRAAHQPDRVAYTFLADGEDRALHWTWAQVDRRARAVAAWLQTHGDVRGERALLLFEEGLDYLAALFGCMYAGALAVPVHPPDPHRMHRTLPRLTSICEDAGVRFVLTEQTLADAARGALGEVPVLGRAEWLAVDTLGDTGADRWVEPALGPTDLAYLQYTSGSTSTPKGVMISHWNLLHQLQDFDTGYDHSPDSVVVTWLPATHDLGLVYGRFMNLFIGCRCVFLSPVTFMQRPFRWMRAVSTYRGTHTPSPNFGFELAVRKASPAELATLDLSSLRVVLNGAEPIREESEVMFVQGLRPYGLRPEAVTHAMGMSEATAKIITEPIDRATPKFVHLDPRAYEQNRVVLVPKGTPGARAVASCGSTVLDTRVVIADPETCQDLGEDRVGEMWVSGTTVAQGYFHNPEATERTFRARLADGAGPFLRTGDLAFVHEGEVYLTGRLKDVIIIRGQNHHPQDVEWSIQTAHPAVRPNCAAAFSVTRDGEEQLVVVTEVQEDKVGDPETVFGALRAAIAEHGLHAVSLVLLPSRGLPKTTSGKIQRTRSKELFEAGQLPTVARWDAHAPKLEAAPAGDDLLAKLRAATGRRRKAVLVDFIVDLTASLLGLDADDVEADRPLGQLGLDSVTAVEMVERVGKAIGRKVPGTLLFDYPTIDAIAGHLLDLALAEPPEAPKAAAPAPKVADVASMTEEEAAAALLEELKGLL